MVASAVKNRGPFTGLRPVDVARDLGGIADILEAAFADELEPAQWAILREMRRLRFVGPILWLFSRAAPEFDLFTPGFVWIEQGRLVGNVTVMRLQPESRHWLISNVAVHPDYRRLGIGRRLVSAALELVESRGGDLVTLGVRHDNDAAQALYRGLGFERVYATVCLRLDGAGEVVEFSPLSLPPAIKGRGLRPVRAREWPKMYALAREAIPRAVQRIMPVHREQFERTLDRRISDWLAGLIHGQWVHHWAVEHEAAFVALLTLVMRRGQNTCLKLMIHPWWQGQLEEALTSYALRLATGARPLEGKVGATDALEAEVPDYLPEAITALERVGFARIKTEDYLALELAGGHRSKQRRARLRPEAQPEG